MLIRMVSSSQLSTGSTLLPFITLILYTLESRCPSCQPNFLLLALIISCTILLGLGSVLIQPKSSSTDDDILMQVTHIHRVCPSSYAGSMLYCCCVKYVYDLHVGDRHVLVNLHLPCRLRVTIRVSAVLTVPHDSACVLHTAHLTAVLATDLVDPANLSFCPVTDWPYSNCYSCNVVYLRFSHRVNCFLCIPLPAPLQLPLLAGLASALCMDRAEACSAHAETQRLA